MQDNRFEVMLINDEAEFEAKDAADCDVCGCDCPWDWSGCLLIDY